MRAVRSAVAIVIVCFVAAWLLIPALSTVQP